MGELLLKDEVYAIVGAAMQVKDFLGSGYLEAVYQEAMGIELDAAAIPYESQRPLRIRYKDRFLQKEYIADFVCYGRVVVEIKAIDRLTPRDEAQLLNYLKTTGMRVGVLINFGSSGPLEWKRLVL